MRRVVPGKVRAEYSFTLIELLIVSVIILTLVAFSTPLFRKSFSDLELKEAVSNISRLITFAQHRAIIDKGIYKITFDFEKKTYQLKILTTQYVEGQKEENYTPIKDRFGRIFYIPRSIAVEGRFNEVLFYPDGHCDNGIAGQPEQIRLTLTNKNNTVLTLATTGILGNVVITEEKF